MAAPKTLTVEHQCEKRDIATLGQHKGKWNARTYRIGDHVFTPGTLKFRGFAGAFDEISNKFRGVLRFEPGAAGDIIIARAFYAWPLMSPTSFVFANMNGDAHMISTATAFRNEPF
jgi:hypothetical protein